MNKPSSPVVAFTPNPDSVHPDLQGLAWGVRKIYLSNPEGEDQYIVYLEGEDAVSDPKCNRVLGSGFNVPHASWSAQACLALRRIKPSFYWPRLEGCTFTTAVEEGNSALQHVVINPAGFELGRADTREKAARMALHRVLSDKLDVSYDEFRAIAVPALVERGGRRTYGAVFADSQGQDAVNAMVANMYRASSDVREGARAVLKTLPQSKDGQISESEAELKALRSVTIREVLSALGDAAGCSFRLSAEDGGWEGYVVLHTHAVSRETALRHAYEEYLADREAQHMPRLAPAESA